MLSVAVLYSDYKPIEENTPFQLVSPDGTVVGSANADAGGVVTFDVDTTSVGQVAVRVDMKALDERLEALRKADGPPPEPAGEA